MFLIIDGSSMLSSNYYGSLPNEVKFAKTEEEKQKAYSKIMQTTDGKYTNGVYASLRMILDIIYDFPEIDHMAVVFDVSRNTFRRNIDPEYKAQRKPTPSPLSQQFRTLHEILQRIGICVLADPNFEADDIAGSIIERFKPSYKMVFMTKDHDYLQLIDKQVGGWIVQNTQDKADAIMENRIPHHVPGKVAYFDTITVINQEGVKPCQIPDLKGLCGDASDNIKGVSGVGPSAAIPLLKCYPTIEALYQDIEAATTKEQIAALQEKWKKHGCKRSPYKKLINAKNDALLSKQLATIKRDIVTPPNELEYRVMVNKPELQKIITEYEFQSLANYVWNK